MNKKLIFKILIWTCVILLIWGLVWTWHVARIVKKNNSNSDMKNQHVIVKNIIVTETQDEKKYWELVNTIS